MLRWLSILVITMPTKGKLLLTAVSIVIGLLSAHHSELKAVAAVRSGTRAKVSSTYLL